MSEIKIFPIFDQAAPKIWDDFISIRAAALEYNYKFPVPKSENAQVRQDLKRHWRTCGFNFAFAAYDADNMVGFTRGNCWYRATTVHSLYIRPEYQGTGIGRKLLTQVERISGFETLTIDLISLAYAVNFYRKMGYRPVYRNGLDASNEMFKRAPNLPTCTVLPVFHASPIIRAECDKIATANNVTFDPKLIDRAHARGLVYINDKSEITGYGIQTADALPDIHVAPHNCFPYIKGRLEREFTRLATMPQKTK